MAPPLTDGNLLRSNANIVTFFSEYLLHVYAGYIFNRGQHLAKQSYSVCFLFTYFGSIKKKTND